MSNSSILDREVIYSYDAGKELYFLKGIEEAISIYYRDNSSSYQYASITRQNPKFQEVKYLLKKNNIYFSENEQELWFRFKPKIIEINNLMNNNEYKPLDKLENSIFTPFNLYSNGRIYRYYQFSSSHEKEVSDRIIFMNYVINESIGPGYFKVDYYGSKRGTNYFIENFGKNINLVSIGMELGSNCSDTEEVIIRITPGITENYRIFNNEGVKEIDKINLAREIVEIIESFWKVYYKVPLEATIRGNCKIELKVEGDYLNQFLSIIKSSRISGIKINSVNKL